MPWSEDGPPDASYAEYDAAVRLTPTDEQEHFEYVRQVLAERGIEIPDWQPTK